MNVEPALQNPLSRPSIRAQVVISGNRLDQIWRLMWGLVASSEQAKQAERISSLELALGDCSGTPLPEAATRDLRDHGVEAGLANITYEFFDENLGHSGGQNRLAAAAQTDLLLLINPDTYPSPFLITELAAALEDPLIGIGEARQIPFEHPKVFDAATGDTSWASGACMALRRQVFNQVGGFSPEYFPMHCDDVDLSWRVRAAGYRVVHVPRATVFHDKRLELSGYPASSPVEAYYSALGRLMLCVRYSNPELLEQTLGHLESSGDEAQARALKEFLRRRAEHSLPAPLPEGPRVAQFVGGEYAEHRY